MTDFAQLVPLLVKAEVHFILVGGAAATAHGSARLTQDLDIVYQRTLGHSHVRVVWSRVSVPEPS